MHFDAERSLVFVLQCGVALFSGADTDDVDYVVDEDLAVAVVAGVKRLFGGVDDRFDGDLGDDCFEFDLGQQLDVDLGTAIVLGGTALSAAPLDLRDGHTGDPDRIHSRFERFEFVGAGHDRDLGEFVFAERRGHGDGYGLLDGDAAGVARFGNRGRGGLFGVHIVGKHHRGYRHKVGIGAGKSVFGSVEACELVFFAGTKEFVLFHYREQHGHRDADPGDDCDDAEDLYSEVGERFARSQCVVVDKTADDALVHIEDPDEQRSCRAAEHMDADRADRVVDMKFFVYEFDAVDDYETGDDADDRGAGHRNDVASGGDRDKSGKRSVERHRDVGFAVFDPCDRHCRDRGNGRRHRGRYEHPRDRFVDRVGGRAVESVPPEPEDEYAQRAQRKRMPRDRLAFEDGTPFFVIDAEFGDVFADAGTEDRGADECRGAADQVYRRRSGEVVEAEVGEPAAAPYPVAGNGVHDQRDHKTVHAI